MEDSASVYRVDLAKKEAPKCFSIIRFSLQRLFEQLANIAQIALAFCNLVRS